MLEEVGRRGGWRYLAEGFGMKRGVLGSQSVLFEVLNVGLIAGVGADRLALSIYT